MINNSQIKGIYEYNIQIPTMFNVYELKIKNHNIITFGGEKFFIDKWIEKSDNIIYSIVIGKDSAATENGRASKNDIDLESSSQMEFTKLIFDNQRTYLKITVNQKSENEELLGSYLNGACEIGLKDSKGILLTHDIHEVISVPESSLVVIDYYLIFNNSSYNYDWNIVSGKNYYTTTLDCQAKSIINETKEYMYKKVTSISDLIVGTYYQELDETTNNYKIYLYPNTGESLTNDKILITFME